MSDTLSETDEKIVSLLCALSQYSIEKAKAVKTVEQALKAVEFGGCMLEYVPEELRTAEVCFEAVRNSLSQDHHILHTGNALEFVPEALKTAELCAEAVKNNSSAFKYVPKTLMTEKLCTDVVKRNGCLLEYVPEEFKTLELCIEAVRDRLIAIVNVPKAIQKEVGEKARELGEEEIDLITASCQAMKNISGDRK